MKWGAPTGGWGYSHGGAAQRVAGWRDCLTRQLHCTLTDSHPSCEFGPYGRRDRWAPALLHTLLRAQGGGGHLLLCKLPFLGDLLFPNCPRSALTRTDLMLTLTSYGLQNKLRVITYISGQPYID